MLGWTEDQFWAEVEFVEKILQTHTDENQNSTAIRMCHNDLHPGKLQYNWNSLKLIETYLQVTLCETRMVILIQMS